MLETEPFIHNIKMWYKTKNVDKKKKEKSLRSSLRLRQRYMQGIYLTRKYNLFNSVTCADVYFMDAGAIRYVYKNMNLKKN